MNDRVSLDRVSLTRQVETKEPVMSTTHRVCIVVCLHLLFSNSAPGCLIRPDGHPDYTDTTRSPQCSTVFSSFSSIWEIQTIFKDVRHICSVVNDLDEIPMIVDGNIRLLWYIKT